MAQEELPLVCTHRVRFAEVDRQGVVYFGRYFTYLDEAFTAYLRSIDHGYGRMREAGWTTHVAHADLDYHAAAGFEDVLEARLAVTDVGRTSITATYEGRLAETGERLASGKTVYVAVDAETHDPVAVPDAFRAAVDEGPD